MSRPLSSRIPRNSIRINYQTSMMPFWHSNALCNISNSCLQTLRWLLNAWYNFKQFRVSFTWILVPWRVIYTGWTNSTTIKLVGQTHIRINMWWSKVCGPKFDWLTTWSSSGISCLLACGNIFSKNKSELIIINHLVLIWLRIWMALYQMHRKNIFN